MGGFAEKASGEPMESQIRQTAYTRLIRVLLDSIPGLELVDPSSIPRWSKTLCLSQHPPWFLILMLNKRLSSLLSTANDSSIRPGRTQWADSFCQGQDSSVGKSLDLQSKDSRFEPLCQRDVFLVWAFSKPLTPNCYCGFGSKKWRSQPVD